MRQEEEEEVCGVWQQATPLIQTSAEGLPKCVGPFLPLAGGEALSVGWGWWWCFHGFCLPVLWQELHV